MPLQLETDVPQIQGVLAAFANRVPELRRQVVRAVAREALARIVERTPVDTGRARAGWVQPLETLGGTPPAGWQGPAPVPDFVTEGRNLSTVAEIHDATATTVDVTNGVPYVPHLEFGTRNMAQFAPVRRTLAEVSLIVDAALTG